MHPILYKRLQIREKTKENAVCRLECDVGASFCRQEENTWSRHRNDDSMRIQVHLMQNIRTGHELSLVGSILYRGPG